jgi:hypothetical protein
MRLSTLFKIGSAKRISMEVVMSDGVEIPGGPEVFGDGEPPAAVLRRAISRVESMLDRLEFRSARDGGQRAVDLPVEEQDVPIRPWNTPGRNP